MHTMNTATNEATQEAKGGSVRMRHGGLYKRPGSPIYYARWTVKGKTYKLSTGKTKKRDAETRLAELMRPYLLADEQALAKSVASHIADTGTEIQKIEEEKAGDLRLADAWTAYKGAKNRPDTGAATLHQYELQFAAFEDWASKRKPALTLMREVDDKEAADFVTHLERMKRTPNTINKYLNLLQLVWRVLAKPARLANNPWTKNNITRKSLDPVERRELTLAELKIVCASATGELATLLALGLFTGLRLGDCCTLRWGGVDLERGIIHHKPRKTSRQPNPTEVIIPIHPELLAMLKQADQSGEYVMPEYAAAYLKRNSTVTARIQTHFADCGIVTAAPERKQRVRRGVEVGFHSLRHSFVSLCANAGVPLAAVQSLVGHSNPAMTRHYTHIGIEAAQGAIAALPSVSGATTDKVKAAQSPADALKTILGLARGITAKNWQERKKAIIAATQIEDGAAQ
jgi:integrase